MPAGAVHPNTGNFSRVPRLSIVDRMRRLVSQKAYEKRPDWMDFVERAPPMELLNLKLRDRRIKSPYPAMVRYVLSKYPDMRFQDCFVDGNDWTKGNDRYRNDHPVMQFVARQLQLMNEGIGRKEAFEKTQKEFLSRREEIEKLEKFDMALAQNNRIVPAFDSILFTSGAGVAHQREVDLELMHLNHIRRKLRMLRKEIEPHDKRRMSAKELALDLELERTSLLPRMTHSVFKSAAAPFTHEELPEKDIDMEQEFSHQEYEREVEFEANETDSSSTVFEPSVLTDRNPRPADVDEEVSWESIGEKVWKTTSTTEPVVSLSQRREPVVARTQTPPAFTLSRPDKLTLQAILAKKQKEEIRKRIGKEPGNDGDDEQLDFEDFLNMIKSSKK